MGSQVAEALSRRETDSWCARVDHVVAEIVQKSRDAKHHRDLLADGQKLPPGVKYATKYPSCSELQDVRDAAAPLVELLPELLPIEALHDVGEDRTGAIFPTPERMCRTFFEEFLEADEKLSATKPWAEFAQLAEAENLRADDSPIIGWLWVPRMLTDGDGFLKRPAGGRVSVTSKLERGEDDDAPLFRIEISLPWWLLAHPDEQRAEVHRLLCYLGLKGDAERGFTPYKRKPHLIAHAAHVARFGAPRDPMAASVVAHLSKHPTTPDRLRRYGFDAKTKQGLLWAPAPLEDAELDQRIANLRAPVS